ncbi:MAG: response regulator [Hormoscilla sp.]
MTNPITVMIVEDSPEDRDMYRRFLTRDNPNRYKILEFESGSEAIDWCLHSCPVNETPPDLILLDYNLPDMNGLEFMLELNLEQKNNCSNWHRQIPVILLTGQGSEEIAVQAMKMGAEDYLVKGQLTREKLCSVINIVLKQMAVQYELQQAEKQQQLVASTALKIRQSVKLETVLQITVSEVQQLLQADRVLVYRFNPNMSGKIVAEAVVPPWTSCLHFDFEDTCFPKNIRGEYREGKKWVVPDIYKASLTDCHLEMLSQFEVKAILVVPIVVQDDNNSDRLWGLLISHQCSGPHQWEAWEVETIEQLAVQIEIAVQQAELYKKLENKVAENREALAARKLVEAQLRKSEAHLAAALRIANVGSWEFNLLTRSISLSAETLRIFGRNPNQGAPTYKQLRQYLHPMDRSRHDRAVKQAAEKGQPYAIEFRFHRDDGSLGYAQTRGEVIRDARGNPVQLLGTVLDITNLKQTSQQLQALSDRLSLAVKSGAIGIWEWDVLSEELIWDDRMYELYGMGKGDFTPTYQGWLQCLHPDDRGEADAAIQKALAGEKEFDTEFRVVHPNGTVRFLKAYGTIKYNGQRELQGMIGIKFDISDRKERETQLRQTNEQLTRVNDELARATRLKDEFLANMSHELRTPLNAILGLSEGLQEQVFGTLNDRQLQTIGTIDRSGKHLLELINDILDLSKIESGKMELEITEVTVKYLCENSMTFVRQMAKKKNIHLSSRIGDRLDSIQLDERRMRQLLINLLSNGVKFTPSGGSVILEVQLETNENSSSEPVVAFSVRDTGIGIAKENMDKVFATFVQIDSSLNRHHAGTGLGLALVKRIAELHGGWVSVESELGKGSCFTVGIPYRSDKELTDGLSPETQEMVSLPSTKEFPEVRKNPYILLAEDNEANVITISSYLENRGYRIIVAKNGRESLDIATREMLDLILMDIQMPEIDGLEAIRQIRSQPQLADIPIIALTALAMASDRAKCLEAGANEYMAKPLQLKQLANQIQQLTKR